jgi:hypothetical protein
MPRINHRLVGLAAAAVGTAALTFGVLAPSFAQESNPTDKLDATDPTTLQLEEGPAGEGPVAVPEGQGEGSGLTDGVVSSGTRVENVTQDLMLERARIESVNLDDDEEEYVVYSFGDYVHEVRSASDFSLTSYDVDTRVQGQTARIVQGDPRSVLVGFPSMTDINRFSIASVQIGAVQDEAQEGNVPATVPLDGSDVANGANNATDGPDLMSIRTLDTLERVQFNYDEQIDENGSANASKFGYYTLDGKKVPARSIITAEDNGVTVEFDRQTEEASLFYAESGAIRNSRGIESTAGSVGERTTAPDLVSVSGVIGETQFDYTFDDSVSDIDLSKFVLYAADGTKYEATGFARPDATTVRVALPAIQDFSGNIALAAAEEGAVRADNGSDVPNTVGSERVGSDTPRLGYTSGPTLESVRIDNSTGQILFVFDKEIDDDIVYDPNNFKVITEAGDLVTARSFVEVSDDNRSVLMNFDQNIADASRGVAILEGAVKDDQGEMNAGRTLRV